VIQEVIAFKPSASSVAEVQTAEAAGALALMVVKEAPTEVVRQLRVLGSA
jgi:hypothetical protein